MEKISRTYLVLAILAVLGAVGVLLLSLQTANRQLTSGHTRDSWRASRIYVAREILPDHTLYPVLMAVDRVRLEMADAQRQQELRFAYAKRRLFYAKRLLEKGKPDLAYDTFSRAIYYLQQSGAGLALATDFLATHGDQFSDRQRSNLELIIDSF